LIDVAVVVIVCRLSVIMALTAPGTSIFSLSQPKLTVSPTSYALSLQTSTSFIFAFIFLFALSHFFSEHYMDGLWDLGSIAVGFLFLRPNQNSSDSEAKGFSLRAIAYYSWWNAFNVALYIGALVWMFVYGVPPELPYNPPGYFSDLTVTQQRVAFFAYCIEWVFYSAAAFLLTMLYNELRSHAPRSALTSAVGQYQNL